MVDLRDGYVHLDDEQIVCTHHDETAEFHPILYCLFFLSGSAN